MPTILTKAEPRADLEAGELRQELERLQGAIGSLSQALAEANRDRAAAEQDLADHRALLEQAFDLQAALEHRLGELEGELMRERLTSAIRAKLLADLGRSSLWRRGRALRRAARVEALLQAIRST
jgi:hypothetical protein